MGRITTHVLDTANGRPGRGIVIELFKTQASTREKLSTKTTNNDGRCDQAMLEGDSFEAGVYELDFHIGDYFRGLGTSLNEPAFLDIVTLRFGVANATEHFHVPLVVTPWSYSTYRGS